MATFAEKPLLIASGLLRQIKDRPFWRDQNKKLCSDFECLQKCSRARERMAETKLPFRYGAPPRRTWSSSLLREISSSWVKGLIVRPATSKAAKKVVAGNRNPLMTNVDSARLARMSDDGMAIRYSLREHMK